MALPADAPGILSRSLLRSMPEDGDRLGRSTHGAQESEIHTPGAGRGGAWAAAYAAGRALSSAEAIAEAVDDGESQDNGDAG